MARATHVFIDEVIMDLNELKNAFKPLVEEAGLTLYSVEFVNEYERDILRVTVDKMGPVDIDEIKRKLNYDFEIMDMGEEYVAVPVGEGANRFHGMMRMNRDAAEMLRLIASHSKPEDVLAELMRRYPDLEKDDLGWDLCNFFNQLIAEGVLDPEA